MFCPHCGKEMAESQAFCQVCGGKIAQDQPIAAPGTRERTAWEERDRNGFFSGLFSTLKGSLFSPTVFFRTMNVNGGLGDPLLYAMIVGVVGMMVSYVWQILFQDAFLGYLPPDVQAAGGMNVFSGIGIAFVALFLPFLVIISTFLWAGIWHLLLLMVRGANNGFEATFRTAAYSYGSYIFMAIPFCGGLIAFIWNIIVAIIGLKEAHGTGGGKAAFAVLFPMILCCGAVVLIVLLLLGTVAASLGTMKPNPWN